MTTERDTEPAEAQNWEAALEARRDAEVPYADTEWYSEWVPDWINARVVPGRRPQTRSGRVERARGSLRSAARSLSNRRRGGVR